MYWDAVSPSFSRHIFRKEAEPVVFGSGLPNGRAQHHSTQDVLHGAAPKANQVGLGYHGDGHHYTTSGMAAMGQWHGWTNYG